MNLKEIKELIELISEKGFAEFEIERQGFRLRINRFAPLPAPVATQAAPQARRFRRHASLSARTGRA